MLQYIDTHIHLDGEEFSADRDAVVARAREAGVQKMLIPASTSPPQTAFARYVRAIPDSVSA